MREGQTSNAPQFVLAPTSTVGASYPLVHLSLLACLCEHKAHPGTHAFLTQRAGNLPIAEETAPEKVEAWVPDETCLTSISNGAAEVSTKLSVCKGWCSLSPVAKHG